MERMVFEMNVREDVCKLFEKTVAEKLPEACLEREDADTYTMVRDAKIAFKMGMIVSQMYALNTDVITGKKRVKLLKSEK